MIKFKISVLIISNNIKEYSDEDLIIPNYRYIEIENNKICVYTLDKLDSYKSLLNFLNVHRDIDCIITNECTDSKTIEILNNSSTEFIRKWVHFDDMPTMKNIVTATVETMKLNANRILSETVILFSFYTSVYNSTKQQLDCLYNSLCAQEYPHWNWYILDDSETDDTINLIKSYNDARIIIFKNITNHGNIGFNKHNIAMMCNGDWLLEIDHDDEITSDCLSVLYNAIQQFPNSKFVYSDAVEARCNFEDDVLYRGVFCEGLGIYRDEIVDGKKYKLGFVNGLNPISIRSIFAAPNHIRCYKKDFYHKINGHCINLSVLDDLDLMIRAFLNISSINEITYIKKILYLQHNNETTSDSHTTETISYNTMIFDKYDKLIHNKILELGLNDIFYNEEYEKTIFNQNEVYEYIDKLPLLCNVYKNN